MQELQTSADAVFREHRGKSLTLQASAEYCGIEFRRPREIVRPGAIAGRPGIPARVMAAVARRDRLVVAKVAGAPKTLREPGALPAA